MTAARPWIVVVGWLIANLILVGVLFGFGAGPVPEFLYLAAGLPLLAFAVAVGLVARDRRPVQEYVRLPAGSGYAAVAATGMLLCGVGVIFALWLIIVGALLILAAIVAVWRLPRPALPPPARKAEP